MIIILPYLFTNVHFYRRRFNTLVSKNIYWIFSLKRKLVVRHCFKLSIRISDPCTCILNICLKWGFGWSGLNDVLFIPVILHRGCNTHRLKGDYKP